METKKNRYQKNKSFKVNKVKKFEQEITNCFLEMLITIKLFHWNTFIFAQHEASDKLYASLNEHIDKFIEVLLGKTGNRIYFKNQNNLKLFSIHSKKEMIKKMNDYKSYLVDLDRNKFLSKMSNTDLYSIRDDILADLNKFLYLLTLN
jgi:DNA-binding ferritin-like protein